MSVNIKNSDDFVIVRYNSEIAIDSFDKLDINEYFTFLVCNNGICNISAYMKNYTLTKNNLISIIPDIFFKVNTVSADCNISFIAFNKKLIKDQYIFNNTLKYIPLIFKKPILDIDNHLIQNINVYIKLIEDTLGIENFNPSTEYYESLLMTMVGIVGNYYEIERNKLSLVKRKDGIMETFILLTTRHYRNERKLDFYAEKMALSSQYLSYIIKEKAGITASGFIARIVIADAQSKLRSTKTGIQEIAYSLNFSDVSTFGKYFKRYTGVSPKHYRDKYSKNNY